MGGPRAWQGGGFTGRQRDWNLMRIGDSPTTDELEQRRCSPRMFLAPPSCLLRGASTFPDHTRTVRCQQKLDRFRYSFRDAATAARPATAIDATKNASASCARMEDPLPSPASLGRAYNGDKPAPKLRPEQKGTRGRPQLWLPELDRQRRGTEQFASNEPDKIFMIEPLPRHNLGMTSVRPRGEASEVLARGCAQRTMPQLLLRSGRRWSPPR